MLIFHRFFNRNTLERIRIFFYETFRPHSLAEYKEFFTRGVDDKDEVNKIYPWLYARVFALCFIMFAAVAFTITLTTNAIDYPVLILLGGVLVSVPFLVLIFELCPVKRISFLKLCVIFIVCSICADVLICFGYFAFNPENEWAATAWTAVLEEAGKIIPAIAAILILKERRDPMTCFLIAAAVGAGVSIAEDMGYIFFYSSDYYISIVDAIQISLTRGITAVCTHIIWTAFIGWGFSKGKKPCLDFRFWLFILVSVGLHFAWDMPAPPLVSFFAIIACVIAGLWIFERIVKYERREVFQRELNKFTDNRPITFSIMDQPLKEPERAAESVFDEFDLFGEPAPEVNSEIAAATATATAEEIPSGSPEPFAETPSDAEPPAKAETKILSPETAAARLKFAHTGNVIAVIAGMFLSVVAIIYCFIPIGVGNVTKNFESAGEFKAYIQNNNFYEYDAEREYAEVPVQENFAYTIEDGELKSASQKAVYGGNEFIYSYVFLEDGANDLIDIQLMYMEERYSLISLDYLIWGEEVDIEDTLEFFWLNEEVASYSFSSDYYDFTAVTKQTVFYGKTAIIALSVVSGVAFLLGAGLYTLFQIKARRTKNGGK